ncbi:MAG: hypothetical protein LBD06_12735 [Candidatus Accumulibacter sp.]|nr:hypothetical protein [Accumulibacter sp.]
MRGQKTGELAALRAGVRTKTERSDSEASGWRRQKTENPNARFFVLSPARSAANLSVFCPLSSIF